MASDDEADPCAKRFKLDTAESIMNVRDMNKLFPKIDNLEHFPLKVLLNIFTRLNYMDLYNLAENSSRFEKIVKIVLNERYTNEYFVIDEARHSQQTYTEFFERFGNYLKAVQIQNVKKRGRMDKDWIISLLDNTKNLEKFASNYNSRGLFHHVNENITHLTIRDYVRSNNDFAPSRFRNLMKLEIINSPTLRFTELAEVLRNNPALESLVLGDEFYWNENVVGTLYQFGPLMELIGAHLTQLKELEYMPRHKVLARTVPQIVQPSNDVIEQFVGSLKHLESLGLSTNVEPYTDFKELLRRMSTECKNIKHLKSYDIDGDDTELFEIIQAFENIETLGLAFTDFGDEIEFLVEHLPFLRELDISFSVVDDNDWSFVSNLLRKCSTLEKLTVADNSEDDNFEIFSTSEFYDDFIESIQNPSVKIEVKFKNQIVGRISKNEVTWRNKLLRWTGYDQNSSNVNLLDLAKKPISFAANAEQPTPFDLILGYLDLKSLCSLSQTNEKCSQLVESYVKQHSQQHGTFTITNEFNRGFDGLEMFAEYVANLRLNIFNWYYHFDTLLMGFHNLLKLYIYSEIEITALDCIVPRVRHLIYDGQHFDKYSYLRILSIKCPDLETFELKQAVRGHFDEKGKRRLEFRNLKKFTLKYHDNVQQQVENLQSMFNDTKTELYLKV